MCPGFKLEMAIDILTLYASDDFLESTVLALAL